MKYSIQLIFIGISIFMFSASSTAKSNKGNNLLTKGVVLKVTDLNKAQDFYVNTIGFKLKQLHNDRVQLKTGDGLELYLYKTERKRDVKYGYETHAILTLQTNNLDSAITAYKQKGVKFIRKVLENGIGYSAPFRDPFGNVISILEQSKFPVPRFQEPKILNVGLYLPNIESSEKFYCGKLGFKVRTKNYLPKVLPLNHSDNKSIAIILHNKEATPTDLDFNKDAQINILFTTPSLKNTKKVLTKNNVFWKSTNNKNEIAVKDPWGNYSIIEEIQ